MSVLSNASALSTRLLIGATLILVTLFIPNGPLAAQDKLVGRQFSRADFQKLRWLEGAWRGSADGGDPFYERYLFVNDTTIEIQHFGQDATLSQIKRKGSVALVNGRILHRDDSAVWAATSINKESVHLAPIENADNSFSWERQSSDLWLARLRSPDPQGKQTETIYRMERVKALRG